MRRVLSIAAMFLVTLALLPVPVYAADTGTYEILNYTVELTPLSDGSVNMTYYQEWLCTGGHIPWVTVGTANGKFDIMSYGGNVESATGQSSDGWYGVYLTLDEDYTSGETFTVSFSIVQRNLLERLTDEGKWRIEFIPGWYDNCVTDNLTITLNSPVPVSSYSFAPQPAQVIGSTVTWQTSLDRGDRFNVRMESYDGGFLEPAEPGGPGFNWLWVLIPVLLVGLLLVMVARNRRRERASTPEEYIFDDKGNLDDRLKEAKEKWDKENKGSEFSDKEQARFDEFVAEKKLETDINGNYYYNGNFINPWILYWALRSPSYVRPIVDVFTARGAGGRGGSSCVVRSCACVACACACACACAGGGAAGCARKLDYYDGMEPGDEGHTTGNSYTASGSGEDNTKAK
ncbi:MAG: hypothetical protein MUO80_02990 [Dehalococcoidia bacterium]|nr:hypothetical protein [Dehalococcoidia bacterium]